MNGDEKGFVDPWNPSADELRRWAYAEKAIAPCQDFELAVEHSGHEHVVFECAADDNCPAQTFMLGVLYLIVGDAVRSQMPAGAAPLIEAFIQRGDDYRSPLIRLWQTRSRDLLRDPSTFDYHQWCEGGLASDV